MLGTETGMHAFGPQGARGKEEGAGRGASCLHNNLPIGPASFFFGGPQEETWDKARAVFTHSFPRACS